MATFPCPKCDRALAPSGELTLPDGTRVPVYQCDVCQVETVFAGEPMVVALTFIVKDGRATDPATGEVIL